MEESVEFARYQWSKLSALTLGRYGEHWATLRFIECGLEVYSSEVDDRGIDCLVRYAPGRCLEVQVKGVRNRNSTFVEKRFLGSNPDEVEQHLRRGYCVALFMFNDGEEPTMYLIPGYAWLEAIPCLVNNEVGDASIGPYLGIHTSKKHQAVLDRYRFTPNLLAGIIETIQKECG